MSGPDLAKHVRTQFGLRIEPQMTEFLAAQLRDAEGSEIPILGGDARTGIPLRRMISLQQLRDAQATQASA